MLKIWGRPWTLGPPPGYVYGEVHFKSVLFAEKKMNTLRDRVSEVDGGHVTSDVWTRVDTISFVPSNIF